MVALALLPPLDRHALAQSGQSSEPVVRRSRVSVQVPVQSYFPYTAYWRASDGRIVVHLQPKARDAEELLLDASTGSNWPGAFAELQTEFVPMPAESAHVVQVGRAWDQRMAQQLGCATSWSACSSPADAEVLLFSAAQPSTGRLDLEVVDLRELFRRVEAWLSGASNDDGRQFGAGEWAVVELAMQQRARRDHWLDTVRATEFDAARWSVARETFCTGPRLGERTAFQAAPLTRNGRNTGEEVRLDLNSELQEAGLRLTARTLYQAWQRDRDAKAVQALAHLLQKVGQAAEPGRLNLRVGATTRVIEIFFESNDAQRLQLAQALGELALARRSENLWCAARWVAGNDCMGAPAWGQQAAQASTPVAGPASVGQHEIRRSKPPTTKLGEPMVPSGVRGISAYLPGEGPLLAGDATQELDFIHRQKNHMVLATFDERSGRLGSAPGATQGFVFVARALGALRDGRFEVQMAPNGKAPITLRHGRYRVKVAMVLDKTTEEQCSGSFLCKFKEPVSYSRPYRKTVHFQIQASEFTDRQVCDFGPLLPTVADGGERYAPRLKDLRLAIESVHFDLQ